jgi:NitT/TauT family transport system substrate-binding protein
MKETDAMHRRHLLAALPAATLAVGLAASAAQAGNQPGTIIESWFIHAESVGDPVAVEKGFYGEAGLEVTVVPGGPGLSPIDRVMAEARNGALVLGIDYPYNLLDARQRQGLPLVVLASDFQKSAMHILSWKPIESADDIRGVFATWIGYDKPIKAVVGKGWEDRIQIVNQQGDPATLGGWLAKQYDFASAMLYNEVMVAEKVVKEPYYVYAYERFGIDWPENVLFTTQDVIEKYGDKIAEFVQARYRGFKHALDNPDEAVQILLKYNPNLDPEFEKTAIERIRTIMVTGETKAHGLGYLDEAKIRDMARRLHEVGILGSDSIEGFLHPIPSGVMP